MTIAIADALAIQALNVEFAYRVDFGPQESTAELFAEDGWYAWRGKRSVGRPAIAASYRARAALGERTARHLCLNLRLTGISADEVAGRSLMLVFAENGRPPLPAVPLLLADVDDRYVRFEGQWLFKSRQLTDVFADPARTPVLPLVGEDRR
jgi:SnoaL-like domain